MYNLETWHARVSAIRVSGILFLISVAYILVSDRLLEAAPSTTWGSLQTLKGLIYVALVSVLVYFLSLRGFHAMQLAARQREALLKTDANRNTHRMARMVGHDIRNLALVFQMAFEGIDPKNPVIDSDVLSDLKAVNKRLIDLAGRLRGTTQEARHFEAQRNALSLITFLARGYSQKTVIRAETQDVPAWLFGNTTLFEQMLCNLYINAIEASPPGASIEVEISSTSNLFSFQVKDSGPGIPARIRERVWDPMFTTKAQGTGLGLAIVREAAGAFGGAVEFECPSSGGTVFRVQVPAVNLDVKELWETKINSMAQIG